MEKIKLEILSYDQASDSRIDIKFMIIIDGISLRGEYLNYIPSTDHQMTLDEIANDLKEQLIERMKNAIS